MESVGKEIMEDSKRTRSTLTFDEDLHFLKQVEQQIQPEKKSTSTDVLLEPLDVVTLNVSKPLSLPSLRTSPSPKADSIQYETSSIDSRKQIQISKSNSPFQCSFCPKKFRWLSAFERHVLTHKNSVCQMCGSKYKRKYTYQKHCDKCRSVLNQKFICRHCDSSFDNQEYLDMHLNALHGKRINKNSQTDLDISKVQKYECTECDKVYQSRSSRDFHEQSIHKIKCQICYEVFSTRSERRIHRLQHVQNPNYRTFGRNPDGTMNFEMFKTLKKDCDVITTQIIPVFHPDKSRANRRKQDFKSVSTGTSVPMDCDSDTSPTEPPKRDTDPLDLKQEPVEPLLQTNENPVYVQSIIMNPLASLPFVYEYEWPVTTVLKTEP